MFPTRRGLADAGARRLAADRHRLVVRLSPSTRSRRPAELGRAPRRASGALDRLVGRAPRAGLGPRRQPHRRRRPPRVPRRVQRRDAAARVTVPTSTPSSAWTALLGAAPSAAQRRRWRLTIQVPALDAVLARAPTPRSRPRASARPRRPGREGQPHRPRRRPRHASAAPRQRASAFAVKRGSASVDARRPRRLAAVPRVPEPGAVPPRRARLGRRRRARLRRTMPSRRVLCPSSSGARVGRGFRATDRGERNLVRHRLLGAALLALVLVVSPSALANHTPDPTSVTIAGSLQSELGCPGDWEPDCAATHLTYDADDDVWQGTFDVPAGSWEYKAALNDSWDENYGAQRAPDGANIPLNLGRAAQRQVLLRPQDPLDHRQPRLGDRRRARQLPVRARLPRRLGARAACARGCRIPTATASTRSRPPRSRRAATRPRSRSTRAGTRTTAQGGVPDGANIAVHRPGERREGRRSRYDAATHVLTITRRPRRTTTTSSGTACATTRATRSTARRAARSRPARRSRSASARSTTTSPAVKLRLFDVNANGQQIVADDARRQRTSSCYQAGLEAETCDFWQVTLPNARRRTTSGTASSSATAPTPTTTPTTRAALDGGLGATDRRPGRPQLGADASTCPASRRRPGRRTRSSTRSSPTASATATRRTTRKTGDVRYDDPVARAAVGHAAGGLLPQLRRRRRRTARGASTRRRPTGARRRRARAAATTWAATSRASTRSSTTCSRSASTRSTSTRSSTRGSNHRYDTADYTKIDPYFGDAEGLRQRSSSTPTSAGSGSSSTASSTTCRRTARSSTATTTTRRSARASRATSPWRSWFTFHDVAPGPCARRTRDYDGLVRLRLDPGADKTQPGGPELLPDRAGQRSRKRWLAARAPPAGAWTCRATRRSRTATGRRSATVVEADRARTR